MEPLNLVNTKKEWGLIYLLLFFLFLFHLFFHFLHYQEIIQEEVYQDTFIVKNIYPKETYTTLKLSNDSITYFTSINKDQNILKLDTVESFFLTSNISFYDYLKGFYTPSFAITIINKNHHQTPIANFIDTQHTNKEIVDIYKALFLAIPLPQDINIQNANFGVSHLFAISGFHLAVILTFLYFLFNLSYTKVHKNYFPYRNKRFDILVLSSIIIFSYLIYIDLVASFLRSFVMFFIGIIFLRSHIKVLSFNTLLLTFVIIITLFPKLLFSLSLWFSIIGVFYIFLFFHYFKDYNKVLQFIFFNIFIFTSMNPIVHYFFGTTSYEQILSPIFTILFTLFYPISLFLHLIDFGYLLDFILELYLHYQVQSWEIHTPLWLFISFIILSLGSIVERRVFYLFLFCMFCFNFYLYL